MLQEQSVKKLSKSLFKGLASHFYNEFKSKLELYLEVENQNTTTQLQTTQIKGMGNMASSGIITGTGNRSNQLQSYDSRRGDLPPKATRPGQQSVVGIRNNREDTQQDMRIDDSRYYNIQGGNNFSRDESPMTKNYRANQQNSIQEESGQLGSQYRRGGGVTSHSILRKSNINEYSVDNNQSMGGAGSRMKHTTAQSGTIIQQNNKNVSRITSQDQTRMNERDRKGFLRVGDIISIQYNEKVYDGDTKSKKKQDGEVQNINLAKITDKPKMIYKGVINSNGVTNKSFNVIPKQIYLPFNGSSQFQRCLFRIELAQECKYSIIHQQLEVELVELERDLDDAEEEEKEPLIEKIEEAKTKIKENQKFLTEENRNNEYELKMNLGQKMSYGQKIQFKHLFSQQYLTLNQNKITPEHGCVGLNLSGLNDNSYFTLVPSQKIKFNGQSISYQDTFYIQNYIINIVKQPRFYVHVNSLEIEDSGDMAVLEINASHEPSRLKARLFMDHNYLFQDKTCLQSGDPIRLFHKEVNGYLTVNPKEVEIMLPQYPDFLQRQIKQLNQAGANRNDQLQQQKDEDNDINQVQQEDEKKLLKTKIYIERDPDCLFETDSYWEIQKVKPFKGGSILWDDIYRIRHIGTGRYLCVSPEKLELTLKIEADDYDTLFRIRRQSFSPFQSANYEELKSGENIVIENFFQKYIQIYQDFNDDEMEKFQYKVKSLYHKYSQESTESQIPTVCGFFSKDDVSKMIFEIQEVPKLKAMIAYQAYNFFESFKDFYGFLNYWAVLPCDEDEDAFEKFKYDPQNAVLSEYQLMQNVEDFLTCLLYLDRLLHKAIDENKQSYIQTQNFLSEQGILSILVKLLELIYYKTVPFEEREQPFLSAKNKGMRKIKMDDNDAELIAREYLDPLAEKIMKSIFLLLRFNELNANIMTRYDGIIYNMLQRYDVKIVSKIFKETFKRATYIHNDRSAAIMNEEGLNLRVISQMQDTAVGNHFNQTFGNQINKWAEMIETVSYMDERDQNINKQILYLKVIGLMCCDVTGKALYHYQMQAVFNLISNEQNVPIRFSIQKKDVDRIYVSFIKKNKENTEIFFLKNPNLREIFKQNTSAYAKDFEISFDLAEITQKWEFTMPYIDYICTVLDLYTRMCMGRNVEAVKKVRELGLSPDLILNGMTSKVIHERFKAAFVNIARVLYVDCDPFPSLNHSKNRCYFWDVVGKAHAHKTMYGWEKQKYENVHQNKIISNAQEQIRETAEKIRYFVNQFFQTGPSDIIEFLYSYATKTYTKGDIDPKLKLFINNVEIATSLIECEHVDSRFIYRMIKTASLLFLSYNIVDVPEEGESSWIVRFMKVSKQHRACTNKIELLEQKVLKLLQTVCKYRLGFQVMVFLKLFKKSQEDNDLPNIFIDQTDIDQKFNIIFSLYQFSVDKNATSKMLEELKFLFRETKVNKNNAKNMTLLDIEDIQLSDIAEEVQDDPTMKNLKKKQMTMLPDNDLTEEEREKLEAKKKKRLKNKKYALYEFLIYLTLSKNQSNQLIKREAVDLLVENFKQRHNLLQELIKVELLISFQDKQEYQDFKFQTFRLSEHIDQLSHDDLYYLLYMNIDKEKYKKCVSDVINILRGLSQSLKGNQQRLFKKQNMLRHLDVQQDLLGKLMKNLYFKPVDHFELYNEISNFLFMYSYENPNNQKTLLGHLNFLCDLLDKNIPNTKLISQVISHHKRTQEGSLFLEFLLQKLVRQNFFKSYILKLLVIMTQDSPSNQVVILKRLIKKKRFRKRLYLDSLNNGKKVELVSNFKKKIHLFQQRNALKNDVDWERINLHLSTIDLLAACSRNSLYGILQARKLIEVEALFDSILHESVPYLFKKHYFRLLFEIYINDVADVSNMDLNSQKFVQVLMFVVLDDLKQYPYFYTGLVTKLMADAKRDNENEKNRESNLQSLEKMSKIQVQRMSQERTALEIENYKESKQRASGLRTNQSKPYPLINDSDFQEYWKYLSQFQKSLNQADGLLHFIRDFYRNIRKIKFKMNQEIVDITARIKDVLINMSDDLHSIYEKTKENLIDIDQIIFHINEAIASIPSSKKPKQGIIDNQEENQEDDEAQMLSDESNMVQDLDDSKMLDIRMASDKILRIVRDHIISKNCQIKEAFDIESISNDEYISKFQLKKKLKDIAGMEASFAEIDKAISFFVDFSREQQQERKIMQVEIGQEGHIHSRNAPNPDSDLTFNFRDFEILLKKILQKAGYKPPHQKRDRQVEEQLLFKMTEEELSQACNNDMKLYSKSFFDFCMKYVHQDELKDLILKISKIFNKAFEKNQTETIKEYVENMIEGFQNGQQNLFLIRILKMILEQYTPQNFDEDTEKEVLIVAKKRLNQLQIIFKDCKVCELILKNISKTEKHDVSHECVLLLNALLCQSDGVIQDELLKLLKGSQQHYMFFEYIQNRLQLSSEKLIKESEIKLIQQTVGEEMEKKKPGIKTLPKQMQKYGNLGNPQQNEVVLTNINQQPFYMSQRFDLESELEKLQKQSMTNELMHLLKLVQMLCNNSHKGFQNYIRNQDLEYEQYMQMTLRQQQAIQGSDYISSINILAEIANMLIKFTLRLNKLVFQDFIVFEHVEQIFISLISLLNGPCPQNQKLLGFWKNFCRSINYFFSQDLGYYSANTTEQKSKLILILQSSRLLTAMIESSSEQFQRDQLKEITQEVKMSVLKSKMVEIFQFKIGGDDKKLHVYMADLKCRHYLKHGIVRGNTCEKDEYCQYGHLIYYDEQIIQAGFNIFNFFLKFYEILPDSLEIKGCDFDMKNDDFYHEFKDIYMLKLKRKSYVSKSNNSQRIEEDKQKLEADRRQKAEDLLQQMALLEPSKKMFPEKEDPKQKKQQAMLEQGIDAEKSTGGKIVNQYGELVDDDSAYEDQIVLRSQTTRFGKKKEGKCRRYCCLRSSSEQGFLTRILHLLIFCTCFTCCRKQNRLRQNKVMISGTLGDVDQNDELLTSDGNGALNKNYVGDRQAKKLIKEHEEIKNLKLSMKSQYKLEPVYSFEQFKLDTAIRFYISNVSNVEVNLQDKFIVLISNFSNGQLSKVMFQVPSFCSYISDQTRKDLSLRGFRSNQIEKLDQIYHKIPLVEAEMKSLQRLAKRSSILIWISLQWTKFSDISYWIIIAINIMMLIFYKVNISNHNVEVSSKTISELIEVLAIVQMVLAISIMISYFQRFHGVFYQKYQESLKNLRSISLTDFKGTIGFSKSLEPQKDPDQQQISLKPENKSTLQTRVNYGKEFLDSLKYIFHTFYLGLLMDIKQQYYFVHMILSIVGLFYFPIFSFLLLEIIIKVPILTKVIQSLLVNWKQIVYTFLLVVVFVYIYAIIAIQAFRDDFYDESATDQENPMFNGYCESLIMCFTTTLNNGLRASGGIGDTLEQLNDRDKLYWGRWFFDITFFLIIIILLLNLVLGIIIDAFAELRDQNKLLNSDMRDKCFICGLTKSDFEKRNKSFKMHILREHNIYSYLYFMLYLQHKEESECSGVERYVKNQIQNKGTIFFPINRCTLFEDGTTGNNYQQQH